MATGVRTNRSCSWAAGTLVLVASAGLCAPASAQRPGHLGKRPSLVKPRPARSRTVPTWPRRADPPPLRTTHYLVLEVKLHKGKVSVVGVRKRRFAKARVLPRFRGRFEVRLYAHGLLRDVVRFGFPLTAAGAGKGPRDRLGLELSRGVAARATVKVPFDARINRITIHDSLERRTVPVDLSRVLPGRVGPRLPADLRTGTLQPRATRPGAASKRGRRGRAGPGRRPRRGKPPPRLEDSAVLKGASGRPRGTAKPTPTTRHDSRGSSDTQAREGDATRGRSD